MENFPWDNWKIESGALKTLAHKKGVDIISKEKYKDFELELEWKVQSGGNSGIFYFANEKDSHIWQSAPEMQVLDNIVHVDGKKTITSAGALYDLIAPSEVAVKPVGEFNQARIVAKKLNAPKITTAASRSLTNNAATAQPIIRTRNATANGCISI